MTAPDTLSVLLVLPPAVAHGRSGNEVSAQRLVLGLRERGVTVRVARADDDPEVLVRDLSGTRPDLVHGFHARRSGRVAREVARRLGVPLVVTITGTDVNSDRYDEVRRVAVAETLEQAAGFLCGDPGTCAGIREFALPEAPVLLLSKGVTTPEELPEPVERDAEFHLLHVAHVRPVKNQRLALQATRRLRERGLDVRLTLLGDVLDEAYAAALEDEFPELWSVSRHPSVPHEEVGAWYVSADVVLLTSDSEGGSNAVLEAMAHGRCVVASDVPANRAYLGRHRRRGCLYPARTDDDGRVEHDLDALVQLLDELLADADARRRIGSTARTWVARHHRVDQELHTTLGLYRSLLGA